MSDDGKVIDLDARRGETIVLKLLDAVAHIRAMIERINHGSRALAANDEVREIRVVLAGLG